MKEAKKLEEVSKKNIEKMQEFMEGEEGIDYAAAPKDYVDPSLPNEKLILK